MLGILGAVVGGFLLELARFSGSGLIATFVTAFIGAVILIVLVRQFPR